MSVRAEIDTAVHPDVLVAPIQAVVERDVKDKETDVVFVAKDGKAVQRVVKTGISDETQVEIVSGVQPGEKVITGPYRSLRDLDDGEKILVTDQKAEERSRRKKAKEEEPKGDVEVEVD
jgi:HlyD family secretion protein